MFKLIINYTLRSFRRNAFYHGINIIGLIIAFTSVFYILIWINQEKSYDNYHPSADRIYRFSVDFQTGDHHSHFARTWQMWTQDIPGFFPGVETMCRLQSMRNARLKIGEDKFTNARFFLADSIYFDFFGNRLLRGDPDRILRDPNTMVLSERMAEKYFGKNNPVGKEILAAHQFDTSYHSYTVTGVMEDPKINSHFKIDVLAPVDYSAEDPGWTYVYFRLKENSDPESIIAGFPEFLSRYMAEEYISQYTPHLQPVRDIHLMSDKDREIEANNQERSIYIFAGVGLIFLLIVFVNNANLQNAMINGKMRFIFLNRVNGAGIMDIARFIAWETAMVYLLSTLAAIIIILLSMKGFDRFFGYPVQVIDRMIWMQLTGLAFILTVLGVLFGLMPVLMPGKKERWGGTTLRKALIVLQFTGSVILVILTLFIFLQIRFMLNAGIGAGQDNLIVLKNLSRPVLDKYSIFKEELLNNSLILDVSATMEAPSAMLMDAMHFEMEGREEALEDVLLGVFPVDDNFLEFYDIKLLAGRSFPEYAGMDAKEHFIINETALKTLKLESPQEAIGMPFSLVFGTPGLFHGGTIIGVAEDFHFYTLKERIKPMVMFQKHIWFWNFLIRINREQYQESIRYVNQTWDKLYPEYPFEFDPVDNLYEKSYRNEIIQSKLLAAITILTMIIACLGLVGLMRYLAAARTREIGIRKVVGAGTLRILFLLNKEFLIMILIAVAIGIPASLYLVRSWLQSFVYRIDIHWWIPLVTGAGFLIISLLTISYQSWIAASGNPVESLRHE